MFLAAASLADESPRQEVDWYDLEISFLTPWNRDFTMLTTIRIGQPFEMLATNGEVRNTVSGTLESPKDGKYPMELVISQWASERANMKSTSKLKLELGKSCGHGVSAGIVHVWFVTLRRHESRIFPKSLSSHGSQEE